KTGSVRLTLRVTLDRLSYELSCGLPVGSASAFDLDPVVKEEKVWFLVGRERTPLLDLGNSSVLAREADGRRNSYPMALTEAESALAQGREPYRFPQLSALRQEILNRRFYHHLRTDPNAPTRNPQVGIRTPILSHDGRDVAAALQTIIEIGDEPALRE